MQKVQIATADRTAGDLQDDVCILNDRRLRCVNCNMISIVQNRETDR